MVNKSKNQIEFYSLGKCKDLIIKKLLSSPDIVSLIGGDTATPASLVNSNIYDSLVIDLTQNETKTYITMDAIVPLIENQHLKNIEITLDIFTHLTLKKLTMSEQQKYYTTGYFGNRIDVLLDHVARLLNGSDDFGIGKLQLRQRNPMGIIQPTEKYYGKYLVFNVLDF